MRRTECSKTPRLFPSSVFTWDEDRDRMPPDKIAAKKIMRRRACLQRWLFRIKSSEGCMDRSPTRWLKLEQAALAA